MEVILSRQREFCLRFQTQTGNALQVTKPFVFPRQIHQLGHLKHRIPPREKSSPLLAVGQSPVYQACVLLRIPNALAPHFERIRPWEHLLDQESCS